MISGDTASNARIVADSCPWCRGAVVGASGRGRPRRWCSDDCKREGSQRLRWLRSSRRPALVADLALRRAEVRIARDRRAAERWVIGLAADLGDVDAEIARLEGRRV